MKQTFKEKMQKIVAIYVVGLMLFGNVSFAFAEDVPTPTPTQSQEQSSPISPVTPITPISPDNQPITPIAPITPAPIVSVTPTPTPSSDAGVQATTDTPSTNSGSSSTNTSDEAQPTPTPQPKKNKISAPKPTPTLPSGQSTTTSPQTVSGATIGDTPSGAVVNSGNGEGSTNTGSSTTNNTTNTNQNNSANVNTTLNQSAVTGSNRANDNIGGDVTVKSGDANVSGTAITGVNSNLDNVAVSEFNVNDVQNGDLILNSASHCISGCGSTAPNVVINKGNGEDSTNTANSTTNNTDNTFQNNDATIGTDMNLVADSGHNRAHDNIDGDTSVESGDANVSANALTLANNNIEGGKVQYNVVNIYGELHGDIILPEEEVANPSATMNANNGANSTNTASNTTNNTDTTNQSNNANINNNLNLNASTGDNYASDNGGGANVSSGDTKVTANVLNVANSNIDGQTMWLVIVNQAGKWVGKLLGADGNMAGSDGTEFIVNDDGSITASNNGNGEGSTNNASSTTNNTNTTTQSNNATINNNLNLSANTGDNRSHDNLGGDNTVKSGDATIIANLINFVNNNISGNGKLVVTVVNVFGSWFGDFIAPGQTKQATTQSGNNSQQPSSNSANSSNNNSANTNSNQTTQTAVMGASSKTTSYQGGNTQLSSNQGQGGNVLVAGASNIAKNSQLKNALTNNIHEISINLAWMVVLLPLLGVAALGRRFLKRNITV